MAKKPRQKYCIQEVSPLQDGYVELSLAPVSEKQGERLDFLVAKMKAMQNDMERRLNEAFAQDKDIDSVAYAAANARAADFKKEYDDIIESLKRSKLDIYWAPKGHYGKGEILDKPPPGSMRME